MLLRYLQAKSNQVQDFDEKTLMVQTNTQLIQHRLNHRTSLGHPPQQIRQLPWLTAETSTVP